MSEERALLAETLERLFGDAFGRRDAKAATGALDGGLWRQVEALGLPLLLVPEAAGGAGGGFEDAYVVARALGRFAAPLPLCETLLAAKLLAAAGIERPTGALSLALRCEGSISGDRFDGALDAVPFGAEVSGVVAVLPGPRIALLSPGDAAIERRPNLASEPRDRLRFASARVAGAAGGRVAAAADHATLFDHAALLRTGQIAGALAAALERSLAHAGGRVQFGKTLSQFQAVQQQLAVMGEEVLAVDCAAAAAFRAADRGDAAFEIACARLRANRAIETVAAGAHQIHGAVGFTREQDLRLFTQRLLAWRSELGNDRYWAARLGRSVAARGPEAFWPDLTARGDASGVAG
jgi:acyl-CoA dehydrogenase